MSATVNEQTLYALTSADGVNWTSTGTIDDRGSNAALDLVEHDLLGLQDPAVHGVWSVVVRRCRVRGAGAAST